MPGRARPASRAAAAQPKPFNAGAGGRGVHPNLRPTLGRTALATLALASLAAAGCAVPANGCRLGDALAIDTRDVLNATDASTWDVLSLYDTHTGTFDTSARLVTAGGASLESREAFSPRSANRSFEVFRIKPGSGTGATVELHYDRVGQGGCGLRDGTFGDARLQVPRLGMTPHPGQGVHVHYAGFWENGTLFETNIKALDQSAWPRAGWYETIPYDPLPVYVYDQSRSEQPAYWKGTTGNLARTGTPVDGPAAPVTSQVDAAAGIGYYSTIKGFNDGLRTASTTTVRVMHMDAKDAYPAGTPNNPLAGDDLVFLVVLDDVVDQPCPSTVGTPSVLGLPCPG